MSDQKINQAARRTNALAYRDGLVDLLLGIFFTLLAFQEPLEQRGLALWVSYLPSFVAMAAGLVAYYFVKRKVIAPRIGLAKISIRRNSARRTILLFAMALQLITLVIYIFAASGQLGEWFPGGAGWVIDAFFAVAIFGFFAYLAHSADAARFYLYGLLLAASVLLAVPLRGDARLVAQLPVMLTGLAMVAGGSITLLGFLRAYPPVDMEAANG